MSSELEQSGAKVLLIIYYKNAVSLKRDCRVKY